MKIRTVAAGFLLLARTFAAVAEDSSPVVPPESPVHRSPGPQVELSRSGESVRISFGKSAAAVGESAFQGFCRVEPGFEPSGVRLQRIPVPIGSESFLSLLSVRLGAASTCFESERSGYPEEPIEIVGSGAFRQVPYVLVRVSSYIRTKEGLAYVESAEAEVETVGGEKGATAPADPAFESLYAQAFGDGWRSFATATTSAVAVPAGTSCLPAAIGGSVYRFTVSQERVYRITQAEVAANTDWTLSGAGAVAPSKVRLYSECGEVALNFVGDGDALLEAGEYFEFWGRQRTGEFVSGAWQSGDYTDDRAYFLVPSAVPGLRMSSNSTTSSLYPLQLSFRETLHLEQDQKFGSFVNAAGDDAFFWSYANCFPAAFPTCAQKSQSHAVTIPDATGTGTASIDVRMRAGWNDAAVNPDHHDELLVNGTSVLNETWDGPSDRTVSASVPPSSLLASSTLDFRVFYPPPSPTGDGIFVNWFDLHYDRLLRAVSNELKVTGPTSTNARMRIQNFTSNQISVWDVSNPVQPVRITGGAITGANPYTITYDWVFPAAGATHFAFATSAFGSVSGWRKALSVDLRSTSNGADWIVIGPTTFISGASVPSLSSLVTLRQGQGLRTKLVDIQDVYDQFGDGTIDPQAIKSFLAFAYSSWVSPAPSFALLVGDSSYDYENALGAGLNNFVPTWMLNDPGDSTLAYHCEDSWFGRLVGTDYDLETLIGRVPARTAAEAEAFYAKAVAYETAGASGIWRGRTLLIADSGPEAAGFEAEAEACATKVSSSPTPVQKMYLQQSPWNGVSLDASPANGTNDILDAVGTGQLVTSWIGHGSFAYWSSDTNTMSPTIWNGVSNSGKLTVVLNADCYTGAFHNATIQPSLLESMITKAGSGAIAAGGPSSYSYSFLGESEIGPFLDGIFGDSKDRRLGVLFERVRVDLSGSGNTKVAASEIFFGDPASRTPVPIPAAPLSLQVTGTGNQSVSLGWTLPGDPSVTGVNVYRATSSVGPFAKVNGTPAVGTAYTDTGLTNGITYWYFVRSVESSSFESNRGVPTVSAVPQSTTPPTQVQGVAVTDLTTGRRGRVSWTANPESDLAAYVIRYGGSPGSLTNLLSVTAAETSARIEPWGGAFLYATVEARNSANLTGPASAVAGAAITSTNGYRPPAMIQTVKAGRLGVGGVRLTVSPPAVDIFGSPVSVAKYRVYRGTSPTFVPDRPSGPNRITEMTVGPPAPSQSTYDDVAPPPGDIDYYVTAVDPAGEESPAGKASPDIVTGIDSIDLGGEYLIVWNGVAKRIDGTSCATASYRVYRGATPGFHPDIPGGSNRLGSTTDLAFDDAATGGGTWYYAVTAVDQLGNEGPF